MMSDNTDLGTAGMLYLGIDPANSTEADWRAAAAVLTTQRNQARGYFDQRYIDALESGETWISQAWSGDIFQANAYGHPELKFIVPEEGVMHWTDNMVIPMNAADPLSAITWMNYYYQPNVAGASRRDRRLHHPGPRRPRHPAQGGPGVAKSALVFPTAEMTAKVRNYPTFKTRREFDAWNGIFNPIITG